MRKLRLSIVLAVGATLFFGPVAYAIDAPIKVNVDNYARAEADMQIDRMLKMGGGVNKWTHNRLPTPLDKQNVIRMNRDTLYSFALVDISKGATVTMPDVGTRYMSMMVINNDGYINKVFLGGGTYNLTMEEFDTPYVVLAVRTLQRLQQGWLFPGKQTQRIQREQHFRRIEQGRFPHCAFGWLRRQTRELHSAYGGLELRGSFVPTARRCA